MPSGRERSPRRCDLFPRGSHGRFPRPPAARCGHLGREGERVLAPEEEAHVKANCVSRRWPPAGPGSAARHKEASASSRSPAGGPSWRPWPSRHPKAGHSHANDRNRARLPSRRAHGIHTARAHLCSSGHPTTQHLPQVFRVADVPAISGHDGLPALQQRTLADQNFLESPTGPPLRQTGRTRFQSMNIPALGNVPRFHSPRKPVSSEAPPSCSPTLGDCRIDTEHIPRCTFHHFPVRSPVRQSTTSQPSKKKKKKKSAVLGSSTGEIIFLTDRTRCSFTNENALSK